MRSLSRVWLDPTIGRIINEAADKFGEDSDKVEKLYDCIFRFTREAMEMGEKPTVAITGLGKMIPKPSYLEFLADRHLEDGKYESYEDLMDIVYRLERENEYRSAARRKSYIKGVENGNIKRNFDKKGKDEKS